ncbi:MAG: LysR family transcriptional regulator [Oscillospiraceae bacterium]|nr:LysR family transcriptional regulator [Oscillospiraceae bacterium]
MTIQQLQYLIEVYRAGSVLRAAKSLFLSQSTVSTAVTSLEDELGYPIFNRSKTGMIPTARGLQVIERATHICENYRLLTQIDENVRRKVRIALPSYTPIYRAFTKLVAETVSDKSVAIYNIPSGSLTEIIEKLVLFDADMSVRLIHEPRMLAVESTLSSKGLNWKILGSIPVVMQIGPGHRLYNAPEITPQDLENDTLVDSATGSMVNNTFLKGVLKLNPENTLYISNNDIRYHLIAEGLGYSIGAEASEHVQNVYKLRSIPLNGLAYHLVAITNPARELPPEAHRYMELLQEELKKEHIQKK